MKKILLIGFLACLSGCSTFNFFGESEKSLPATVGGEKQELSAGPKSSELKYSDTPQAGIYTDRQYKHMTRAQMEEQSDLGSQAGSMWVMEGQGAYLFAQNKARKEGDVLNVILDGTAFKQVETKVSVIKQLLAQLEAQLKEKELQQQRSLASVPGAEAGGANSVGIAASGAAKPVIAKEEVKTASEKTKKEEEEIAEIKTITTKIVERMADGNYRVKGSQPFMIGKREYKVIVAGVIRPEDYNDQGISSQKLLDPQFDVVSIRRGEGRQ